MVAQLERDFIEGKEGFVGAFQDTAGIVLGR